MERNPEFLEQKYHLRDAPEVMAAAKRTEINNRLKNEALLADEKEGPLLREKLPQQDTSARIQNYLDRFKEITDRTDTQERARGMHALKRVVHRGNIIDAPAATDQYLKRQKKIAREQGHGDLLVPASLEQEMSASVTRICAGENAEHVLRDLPNEHKQMVEEIVALIEEQKGSLDQWIDYLASPDATYPDWLKYYAIRNVMGLAKYDKDKKVFPKRAPHTANPFPDLNREALAYVLDAIEQKYDGKKINLDQLEANDKTLVEKLLASENFAKLYGWAIEKITPASTELLATTEGAWITYKQGSDAMPLVQSLQGHGTGWCTAGESVAASQLSRGDFHVYYSLDAHGKPTIPRAGIRMEGTSIAEVRGIAPEQNLDPYIASVVQQKMAEFPDGTAYEKKASDMKQVTAIENKVRLGTELTKDDLLFLYEINSPIEGFGYQKDPRIAELLKSRDPKTDAPIVFDCAPTQIAYTLQDVNDHTKAYIGELFPGIFNLPQLEHIYIQFPEGKIRRVTIEIADKTPEQLLAELKKQNFQVSDYAKYMVEHMPKLEEQGASKTLMTKVKGAFVKKEAKQQSERVETIRLTVRDLGFAQGATTNDVYSKAAEFGLELCPAQVGPQYRLQYKNQPMGEWLIIAMKQISDPDGNPRVFNLSRVEDGVWLEGDWARPTLMWNPGDGFIFRLSSGLRK